MQGRCNRGGRVGERATPVFLADTLILGGYIVPTTLLRAPPLCVEIGCYTDIS